MWMLKPIRGFLERRRFPTLLLIVGSLFVVNLFIPDPVPLIDDLILLTITVILASLRRGSEKSDRGQ